MANISKKEGKKLQKFMTLFWKLIREMSEPEEDDAYWDKLVDRSIKISGMCDSELGDELLETYLRWIEKKWKVKEEMKK